MNNNVDFKIYGVTGYTVMSNYHLRDKSLSIKAKGLLSLMLSLPKEWDYSINGLVALSKDGREMVKSTLNELKDAQYLSIDECRDANGHFKYKYTVYYLPYPKWLEMSKFTEDGFSASVEPLSVEPETVNQQQINNIIINKDNKKDKKDIMQGLSKGEKVEHNILTKELINRNYISNDDGSSFLFDFFFNDLLNDHSYKDLFVMTDYILKRLNEKDYKDENGEEITNKYGYFKNALLSNISKFENMPEDLYGENDSIFNYDWLNDNEIKEDLEL